MSRTPGPWVFVPERGTPGQDDNDKGGIRAHNGTWVCDFGNGTTYYPTEGTPPGEADGALMAAAPRLLEACEAGYLLALQLALTSPLRAANQRTLCLLLAAIADATGQDDEAVQNEFERRIAAPGPAGDESGERLRHYGMGR